MARPRQPPVLRTAAAAALACIANARPAQCFAPSGSAAAFLPASHRVSRIRHARPGYGDGGASALSMVSVSEQLKRRRVTIPLIDLSSESESTLKDEVIVPLPSSHLPDDLTTLNVYGFTVTAPVHKMLVENALGRGRDPGAGEVSGLESCYGHIVQLNPAEGGEVGEDGEDGEDVHPLVGAVGCAAEVLLAGNVQEDVEPPPPAVPGTEGMEMAASPEGKTKEEKQGDGGVAEVEKDGEEDTDEDADEDDDEPGPGELDGDPPLLVLARGSYRFVVREIVQTIPYTVGVVDELLDEEPVTPVRAEEEEDDDYDEEDWDEDDEDEDEDDDDWYLDLTSAELVQRTLQTMKVLVEQRLNTREKEPTPLEMAIMEDAGVPIESAAAKRTQVEEMAAVMDVFSSSLLDFAPTPIDRYYAIGLMGAELADVSNDVRKRLLVTRDGAERLRIVLRELDRKISEASTKKLTTEIEDKEAGGQELKVGKPTLPSWANQIKKGTKVEYFWNEEYGWCGGYVSEEPYMVVDELIITVTFDSDGTVHKLPFTGDEKVRWRPG